MTEDARRLVRNAANIANLSTPLGLAVALATGARLRRTQGLIVAEKARLGFLPAGAITVGSVVLIPRLTLDELRHRIPGVVEHEDAHAWQYAYCLGLPFIPLYFAAMLWSWLRLGDRASGNFFERQAGLELGGYPTGNPHRRSRDADRSA
ncbi:MAG TPA: hypothetical protein PKE40_16500 [Arachnia sp.]|nr:hypothetical protein [Arachnia sp.]HMT87940.1 hypothetical protein [Arachnia sp.]